MLNPFASTLSISSSCDFCTLIANCNYHSSVQMVLTQCWCESLENVSFDLTCAVTLQSFLQKYAKKKKELLLQNRNKPRNLHCCKEFTRPNKKKILPQIQHSELLQTDRQIYTYIHAWVDLQEKCTKPYIYLHFWKSTDARQSLGCMICKACLKMNIWNIKILSL